MPWTRIYLGLFIKQDQNRLKVTVKMNCVRHYQWTDSQSLILGAYVIQILITLMTWMMMIMIVPWIAPLSCPLVRGSCGLTWFTILIIQLHEAETLDWRDIFFIFIFPHSWNNKTDHFSGRGSWPTEGCRIRKLIGVGEVWIRNLQVRTGRPNPIEHRRSNSSLSFL